MPKKYKKWQAKEKLKNFPKANISRFIRAAVLMNKGAIGDCGRSIPLPRKWKYSLSENSIVLTHEKMDIGEGKFLVPRITITFKDSDPPISINKEILTLNDYKKSILQTAVSFFKNS